MIRAPRTQIVLLNDIGQAPSYWHMFGLPKPDYNASKQIGWVTGFLKAKYGVDHGKVVWLPDPWNDQELRPLYKDWSSIVWSSPDPNEPIPDIVLWLFPFSMTSVALTSGSSSPWTVDATWNPANNTVYLVGKGGNSGISAQGSTAFGADGGGGGSFMQLANGAVTGTVDFSASTSALWESSTGASNFYQAGFALDGTATGFNQGSGGTFGAWSINGTPPVPFTLVHGFNGGNGGSGTGGSQPQCGQGGGGAAGPHNVGARGGNVLNTTAQGGLGGGGADGGTQGGDTTSGTQTTHTNGGNGSSGSGGTSNGQAGTGNSGGAGSDNMTTPGVYTRGGNGGSGTDFDASHGIGGGGGGSGRYGAGSGTVTCQGGDGGNYGGGGGGMGKAAAGGSVSFVQGMGGGAIILLMWAPSATVAPPMPIRAPFVMPGGMIIPAGGAALAAFRRNAILARRDFFDPSRWGKK
jgi:hypothetical protein